MTHPLAGKQAPTDILISVDDLVARYFDTIPDIDTPAEQVSFGTSGHRGSSLLKNFTDAHIAAITQAICEYRVKESISGPIYMGKDTHALSGPAQQTALEVLAANSIDVVIQKEDGVTPTPVISHAILSHNRNRNAQLADGIIITPSHNPPEDGGFKYNGTNGGPADTGATGWIQDRANEILRGKNAAVKRVPYPQAIAAATTHAHDYVPAYVAALSSVLNLAVVASSGLRIGVDPLGGASLPYWQVIAEQYGLNLQVTNTSLDPTFRFMRLDHDGKIRMDCSSPFAMAGLVELVSRFDLAVGNDPDADRHGIVAPSLGLLNPNHFLAVAIDYLFSTRTAWSRHTGIGKTLVSSRLIDRIANSLNRPLVEVPVGFKWFVDGLSDGSLGFGGEESAGASFNCFDGTPWSTDKDGMLLCLLAAELTAQTGKDPGEYFRDLATKHGLPYYLRIDEPASNEVRSTLKKITVEDVPQQTLAGEPITRKLTTAPGNGAAIGGIKVETENAWFAARPSGTEPIYKLYAESFISTDHLGQVIREARDILGNS